MDEKTLGKRLQRARQAAGLTQQQLCQRANLSFSTLTKIERGAIRAPSIFTVQAIAGAVDQTLDELVGEILPRRQLSKTNSGASFIYFDVNGCLVHLYQRAFTKLAVDTGASADVVETAFWHYNDEVCRGTMSMSDFNSKLAERIGVESVDWPKCYLDTVEPITEMQELIQWAAEHYRIGLLTNTMPGLLGTMRQNTQIPNLHYDVIVDSSEVGTIKPEAKIYEIAQQRAGVSADEILFIDDDRINLMAAEKLGWHVLSFDDSHPAESAARVRQALEPVSETDNELAAEMAEPEPLTMPEIAAAPAQ